MNYDSVMVKEKAIFTSFHGIGNSKFSVVSFSINWTTCPFHAGLESTWKWSLCTHLQCCIFGLLLEWMELNIMKYTENLIISIKYQKYLWNNLKYVGFAEEIIGDHQCGFRNNRSTTDHIFCIRQILEKKWEHNEAVHQLFIDFTKAYDSVRKEALYNILIEFGIPRKLVRLIKMCLNAAYNRFQVGKHLSAMFPIKDGGDGFISFAPLLCFRVCH